MIWNRVLGLAENIEQKFIETGTLIPEDTTEYDWYNKLYTSDSYRRAHIEIVDKTLTHKILVLHCTIFPHYNDPSPIWGFDAVCGPSKITGAFHDMSSGGVEDHPMMLWFGEQTSQLSWNKPRELPDWATATFSKNIVAAGNVNDETELDSLSNLALYSLDYYLKNVGKTKQDKIDYWPKQSAYNKNNKLNPHVVRSMVSMGVPEEKILKFINEVLYPEFR